MHVLTIISEFMVLVQYCLFVLLHFTEEEIDCGILPHPCFGHVELSGTEEGSIATYTCSEGFELEGTQTRVCQSDGTWSGKEPTCEGEEPLH